MKASPRKPLARNVSFHAAGSSTYIYILRATATAAAGPPREQRNPQVTRRMLDVEAVARVLEGREAGAAEGRRADGRASRKKEQLEAK